MRILASSDFHGNLPVIKDKFDLFLVCGDICPAHDQYYSFQKEWILTEFVDWVNSLPFRNEWSRVVMTGGNHDFALERFGDNEKAQLLKKTNGRCVFLKNNDYAFEWMDENEGIKKLTIFGTSYCHQFGNWAFMMDDDRLKEKYDLCPDNVDIFISHDSPDLNGLGTIYYSKVDGAEYGRNVGNKPLAEAILKKKPRYFFSGHIHTGSHDLEDVEGIKMANVSLLDERYDVTYPILEIEY